MNKLEDYLCGEADEITSLESSKEDLIEHKHKMIDDLEWVHYLAKNGLDKQIESHKHPELEHMREFFQFLDSGRYVVMESTPLWFDELLNCDSNGAIPDSFWPLNWSRDEFEDVLDMVSTVHANSTYVTVVGQATGTYYGGHKLNFLKLEKSELTIDLPQWGTAKAEFLDYPPDNWDGRIRDEINKLPVKDFIDTVGKKTTRKIEIRNVVLFDPIEFKNPRSPKRQKREKESLFEEKEQEEKSKETDD